MSRTVDDRWLDDVVDPSYGIIRDARLISAEDGDPRLQWAWAEPADSRFVFGQQTLNRGSAVSYSSRRAMLKACGEAIERYCSGFYVLNEMTFGTYEALREVAVDPAIFPLPASHNADGTPDENSASRFSERYWCPTVSWNTKELKLVPAEFIYVPFLPKGYRPLVDGISTGLACHSSFERALTGAVLEVIERDAFMIFWYLGEVLAHMDVEDILDEGTKAIIREIQRAGYELYIADIADNVLCPVVLCVAFHRSAGFPKATVGLGTDRNPHRAVLKALEELALGVLGMRKLLIRRPVEYPQSFNTLDDHGFWYAASPQLSVNIRKKFENSQKVPFSVMMGKYVSESEGSMLEEWMSDVSGILGEILFCDVTTRDVAELGLSVVRAVVPGAQPLDISHDRRALKHSRLRRAMDDKGVLEEAIFDEPHPFP